MKSRMNYTRTTWRVQDKNQLGEFGMAVQSLSPPEVGSRNVSCDTVLNGIE